MKPSIDQRAPLFERVLCSQRTLSVDLFNYLLFCFIHLKEGVLEVVLLYGFSSFVLESERVVLPLAHVAHSGSLPFGLINAFELLFLTL